MVKDRVKQLMEERGWKVGQLAVYAGVSDASIYNILNDVDPRLSTVARVARALGVPTCDLLSEEQRDSFIDGRNKLEALSVLAG